VSLEVKQLLIAATFGVSMAWIVIRFSRRGLLSFRYTLGWLSVASLGILSGLLVPIAQPVARTLGLSSASLVGLAALVFVAVITIQLSVSISGVQRQLRTLTEELSRLRLEVGHQADDKRDKQ